MIRVRAPWVKANYFVNEDNYILPNLDTVVLGGTAQVGDTDLAPREADRRHIWQGVLRMVLSLKGAPVRALIPCTPYSDDHDGHPRQSPHPLRPNVSAVAWCPGTSHPCLPM